MESLNPLDIDIRKGSLYIGSISSSKNSLNINNISYNDKATFWDIDRKSFFIESILLRIPIGSFFITAGNWSSPKKVIDGNSRINTIISFINGDFSLRNLSYLKDLEGKTYSQLPRNLQRRIEETEMEINWIMPGVSSRVINDIYRRINPKYIEG